MYPRDTISMMTCMKAKGFDYAEVCNKLDSRILEVGLCLWTRYHERKLDHARGRSGEAMREAEAATEHFPSTERDQPKHNRQLG